MLDFTGAYESTHQTRAHSNFGLASLESKSEGKKSCMDNCLAPFEMMEGSQNIRNDHLHKQTIHHALLRHHWKCLSPRHHWRSDCSGKSLALLHSKSCAAAKNFSSLTSKFFLEIHSSSFNTLPSHLATF